MSIKTKGINMSVSTEIRNKVLSITGMEPVCSLSSHTVVEHLRSMLDELWLSNGASLTPLHRRILEGSVAWCTWEDDEYKALFDDINELIGASKAGNERPQLKGEEFLPDELRLELNGLLANHASFNDELANAGASLISKATKVYSPTVVELLEAVLGMATISLLEEHLAGKIEGAIDKLS